MSTEQATTPSLTLDGMLRQTLREAVREVFREELPALLAALFGASDREPVPRFLTPQEVAARCSVSEKTVRAWVREGKLPASRVGRSLRIERSALDEFLSTQGGGPGAMGLDVDRAARNILSRRKRK